MTSSIQPLPTEVVHLIAAGEVIDSLAAVVRELVENALDAGATRLTVSIWPDHWRVRVADNGAGMSLADLEQAAIPHSTSKISDRDDLWRITSLGFRGEALHSLAQLADLEICSRPMTDGDVPWNVSTEAGWQVVYDHQGFPVAVETMAIAPGTVVTASELFAPWPARRQGLPSPQQQMRAVQQMIQQMALCHPHVTWQVEQNDRTWFSLWPGETAQEILPQLLREVELSDLQALEVEGFALGQKHHLYLLMGLPDRCHRHRPDWVRVALNGRPVHVPELEQTILAAFRRTLPRDRHPVCFVHLHIAPAQIDWNRHPAKTEIYLHQIDYWREQVTQAIAQVLQLGRAKLPETAYSQRVGQLLKTAETAGGYGVSRSIQAVATDFEMADAETHEVDTPLTAPNPLRAIAQVHNMYILAEHPTGIWLVEQHIAHERVLYEQLCDRWHLVELEPPIILNHLAAGQVEQLQRLGLEVDEFGDQLWAVRTAPEMLAQRDDCTDALLELSLGGDLAAALVATACRSAIRNGTSLTLSQMQTLLNQWQQTQNPRTCPHGRPICLSLEESSLSRFFRRHWVIGKSHGI
ncbi:MAG: DNA mismatch repair endonuclease MutL [Cyanothece sp. SIO1E1]|nr:DNA mismatch repair endonuclease MutL [Cyanothece sp. SIO1E1]